DHVIVILLGKLAFVHVIDRQVAVVRDGGVVFFDYHYVAQEARLVQQGGAAADADNDVPGNRLDIQSQPFVRQGDAGVTLIEDMVERANVKTEAVDDVRHRLVGIAELHHRASEVQVGNVGRFPSAGHRGQPTAV